MKLNHPDSLLESLLSEGCRPSRRKGLEGLHKICRAQSESRGEFSLSTIGRLCEAAGLFKWRILYNAGSEDYRQLIEAWSAYTGTPKREASIQQPQLESMKVLQVIEDPALRALVQKVISERNKLRGELNLLKAQKKFHIDLRAPADSTPALMSPSSQPLGNLWNLTNSELDALKQAISKELFESEGWREGSHGEVYNSLGRKLFDFGFTKAIKKVLAVS